MRFTVSNFFHEEIGPLFHELLMRLFPRGTLIVRFCMRNIFDGENDLATFL